jgi:hypothetical protein
MNNNLVRFPLTSSYYLTAMETGQLRAVILLSTLQPTFASVFWVGQSGHSAARRALRWRPPSCFLSSSQSFNS